MQEIAEEMKAILYMDCHTWRLPHDTQPRAIWSCPCMFLFVMCLMFSARHKTKYQSLQDLTLYLCSTILSRSCAHYPFARVAVLLALSAYSVLSQSCPTLYLHYADLLTLLCCVLHVRCFN
ncbi:hypothetical protein FIBSPDRAFT_411431 [Athelia psychrophila]|uniref:Uncharacterized protein n=1 Tax=Athelia psychrophila TaxID=1759441 RepID=A0A166NC35_9AGAM|nr:hypothetical protein FIBSPDRAFT_411431 [Fibularhizoctonia sp. CBS 109695]